MTDDDKSHPLKVLSHDQIPLIAKFIQDADNILISLNRAIKLIQKEKS